jgi:hypothetical protein
MVPRAVAQKTEVRKMKTQFRLLPTLLASMVLTVLATNTGWAKDDDAFARAERKHRVERKGVERKGVDGGKVRISAPEIDASSGVSAIVLLSGVVLLVSESSRRRRLGKDDAQDKEGSDRN